MQYIALYFNSITTFFGQISMTILATLWKGHEKLWLSENKSFPENLEFETMNMQKQPEKNQFPTSSSLVVFYTNDFSDLIDKSTSQG